MTLIQHHFHPIFPSNRGGRIGTVNICPKYSTLLDKMPFDFGTRIKPDDDSSQELL